MVQSSANGEWTCAKCKTARQDEKIRTFIPRYSPDLRNCRKERIQKTEFDPANANHFRLQTRGGSWRYYRRVV